MRNNNWTSKELKVVLLTTSRIKSSILGISINSKLIKKGELFI